MYYWQPITQQMIPTTFRPWLTYRGNLTGILAKIAGYRFICLAQTYSQIPTIEQALLQQTTPQALVRSVIHYADDQPLVIARTVVNDLLYQRNQVQFDTLGHQPIGQTLLYHRQDVQRSAFEFAIVPCDSVITAPFKNDLVLPAQLYARRSTFTLDGLSLLIIELFFPAVTYEN